MEKLFSAYYAEYRKRNKAAYNLDSFVFPFEKLSKQQLNQLMKKNQELLLNVVFCREWLTQNYRQFTEEYSKASTQPLEK